MVVDNGIVEYAKASFGLHGRRIHNHGDSAAGLESGSPWSTPKQALDSMVVDYSAHGDSAAGRG